MACTLTCLLEAWTAQNDNLLLPIFFELCITLAGLLK